jgi:hypothetical protein
VKRSYRLAVKERLAINIRTGTPGAQKDSRDRSASPKCDSFCRC